MEATSLLSLSIVFRNRALTERRAKQLISICLALGICALAGWNVMAQTGAKTGLILPGRSVSGVRLGGDAAQFEQVFPKRSASDDHSPSGAVGRGCPTEIYYWSDLAPDTSVVTAFLNNGAISQISTQGPAFSLPHGLKVGATEAQVKQAYPKGQGYVLLGSASRLNGGRNLVYWVDEGAGVAIKLAWWPKKKKRAVSGIDVFAKGSEFRPDGCISPPQQWQKLKQTSHPSL